VPDDSDDYAADFERQVETKKLWQRFHKDNCKPLRKEAIDLNVALKTVSRGSQASHAKVSSQFRALEKRRSMAAKKQSSATGQKEVFNARLRAIFEEAASPPVNEFEGDTECNRQFTIISNTDACNYQLWRLEEDPGRKANSRNLLPLSLIELLGKPLPRYLEDMGAPGVPGRFVDVDEPDANGEFTHPQDTSRFSVGLTPAGYYSSGTFDVHGEEPAENDFSFLQGKYAGETILLKEFEPLKGGIDDLRLVLDIRIKLLLEYQLVKAQPRPYGSCAIRWEEYLNEGDKRYHASAEQIVERFAFVLLTAEAATQRKLVWERKLTSARKQMTGLLRKQKRVNDVEEVEEDESEDEGSEKDESQDEDEGGEEDESEDEEVEDEEEEGEEEEKGAVLKDNVVWSSTDDGFPLCTFRSFGNDIRADGTIAIGLTSSDEARVFKSSAALKASLLATLDAYAAAIVRKKDAILQGGVHPQVAFTLSSAPEARIAVVVGTQEAQVSPTSTPSAEAQEKVPPKGGF
jgi:hypothetical protein